MKLSELSKGQSGRVYQLSGPEEIVERLRELGLHQGVEVQRLSRSPLGGPILFQISRAVIALREPEAGCIEVECLP